MASDAEVLGYERPDRVSPEVWAMTVHGLNHCISEGIVP